MGTVKRVDSPALVKLQSLAKDADRWQTKVGWFEGNNYVAGTPVAYVAAIMEHGAPSVGVPPRPYIRPTIDEQQKEWARLMAGYSRMVVRGNITIKDAFDAVGGQAVGDIQKTISTISEPALSDTTMMLRKFATLGSLDGITGSAPVTSYSQVMEARELVAKQREAGTLNFGGVSAKPLVAPAGSDAGRLLATITFRTGDKTS